MTLKQQYEQMLVQKGFVRVRYGVSKDKWQKVGSTSGYYVFVGLAGSLRYGKTLATSRPVSQSLKDQLLRQV